jgi:hypothetical protein
MGGADAVSHASGEAAQVGLSPLPVMLHIYNDPSPMINAASHDKIGDELQGAEDLAATPNQHP